MFKCEKQITCIILKYNIDIDEIDPSNVMQC
jgi:hypothetical protein